MLELERFAILLIDIWLLVLIVNKNPSPAPAGYRVQIRSARTQPDKLWAILDLGTGQWAQDQVGYVGHELIGTVPRAGG